MAIEITDANFEELVINSGKPALIDFGAEWCPPCKLIAPLVDKLAQEYEGKAVVGKVDVDNNPNISVRFGVRNLPTVLYIKNGQVVDKQVGSTSKTVLASKLEAQLK